MGAAPIYQVGKYKVDLTRRRVSSNGSTLDLGWRHFEALRLLVEAEGGVVRKEQFFEQVWQGQLVDESNLTKCIAQLRKSLNNGGGEADYVETVPRVGYRLAAPVEPEREPSQTLPPPHLRWRWFVGGVFLTFLLVVGGWYATAERKRLREADAAYQEGRRLRRQKDPAALGTAIDFFHKAVELDPKNAQYYGTLAEALSRVTRSPAVDPGLMLETAEKAVSLDPHCAGCNAVLGFILFSGFQQWDRAERHLKLGLELNPRDAGGHGYYAMLLAAEGRLEEASRQAETGIAIDPYLSSVHAIRSGVRYFAKQYSDSAAAAARALSIGQESWAWDWRAYSYLMLGDPAAAVQGLSGSGMSSYPPGLEATFHAGGIEAAARLILETTKTLPVHYRRAHWSLVLGDRTGALDELEEAYAARDFNLMFLTVDPLLDPLAAEPRFKALATKMKLPSR